uniref:Uncharacterized protein n=1 Tax=Magallana gigas TaxID=29159 RepID=K1PVT0_MAGGI
MCKDNLDTEINRSCSKKQIPKLCDFAGRNLHESIPIAGGGFYNNCNEIMKQTHTEMYNLYTIGYDVV